MADFARRTRNCFDKGVSDRKRHLAQLARVLPRAEQLFAIPNQRLDRAGERLSQGLYRNLQIHRARLVKAEALLRPRPIASRIGNEREKLANLGRRAQRCQTAFLAKERGKLESLARILDSISYKAVLERGFALVRGTDGKIRRRAGEIKAGEGLAIVFADGEPAGCGGWSRRNTLYGGDHTGGRNAALLDPAVDAARVRAMYTHPSFLRRGIGRLILDSCEAAARSEGFGRLQLAATLAGEPLYRAYGFHEIERFTDGGVPLIRMEKRIAK